MKIVSTSDVKNKTSLIIERLFTFLFGSLRSDETQSDRSIIFVLVYLVPISSFVLIWVISSYTHAIAYSSSILILMFILAVIFAIVEPRPFITRTVFGIVIQGMIWGVFAVSMHASSITIIEPVETMQPYYDTTNSRCPNRMAGKSETYTFDVCLSTNPIYVGILENPEKYEVFVKASETIFGAILDSGLEIRYKQTTLKD